jgi:integrase
VGSIEVQETNRGERRYEARWRDNQRRAKCKRFKTKREAQTFLARIETDLSRGSYVDPKESRIPFGDWVEDYRSTWMHLRPQTRAKYESLLKNHLLPVFGDRPLSTIKRMDVQSWVDQLGGSDLKPRTVRECHVVLYGAMQKAVEERVISANPCTRTKLPSIEGDEGEEASFLLPDQIDRLLAAIDSRYRPLLETALYLGLRWEEVAAIKRTNLDLLRKKVKIVGTLERTGSGSYRYTSKMKTPAARRTLAIPSFLVECLAKHLESAPASEFLFPAAKGGFLRYDNFRVRVWDKAVKRAGLEGVTFHSLRHTFAAMMIDKDVNVYVLQKMLGHKDIRTTLNVYGHLYESSNDQVLEAMEQSFQERKEIPSVGFLWASGGGKVLELPKNSP